MRILPKADLRINLVADKLGEVRIRGIEGSSQLPAFPLAVEHGLVKVVAEEGR